MNLRRFGRMAIVGIPMIMIYFMLRHEVLQHFTQTHDIVAALAIGAASAILANYMWPSEDDEDGK